MSSYGVLCRNNFNYSSTGRGYWTRSLYVAIFDTFEHYSLDADVDVLNDKINNSLKKKINLDTTPYTSEIDMETEKLKKELLEAELNGDPGEYDSYMDITQVEVKVLSKSNRGYRLIIRD